MKERDESVPPLGGGDLHLAAHLFAPARLTLARELRAITKIDLAERVHKTPSAISQFESGRSRPDAKTLASIAMSLGLPVGFFARASAPPPLSAEACHFRSLRATSQRERKRLLSVGSVLFELLDLLETRLELPQEQVSAVTESAEDLDAVEECAVRVRRSWGLGLGPIPNIVKLLESKGVLVAAIPDDCATVDAFSAWHEGRPMIFLVMAKDSTSRRRLDAAHELGHLVMHADVVAGDQDHERQAHRFAAAFLVPKQPFLVECPRRLDWDHFYELKRRWRVSVAALVKRAYDLGRLSEASYRRAFVHLNATGERTQERDEPPAEPPTLLSSALREIADQLSISDVAARLCLNTGELRALIEDQ